MKMYHTIESKITYRYYTDCLSSAEEILKLYDKLRHIKRFSKDGPGRVIGAAYSQIHKNAITEQILQARTQVRNVHLQAFCWISLTGAPTFIESSNESMKIPHISDSYWYFQLIRTIFLLD